MTPSLLHRLVSKGTKGWLRPSMLLAALALPLSVAQATPTITFSSPSGSAGSFVDMVVTFDPSPSSIMGMQFNLTLPPQLSTETIISSLPASKTADSSFSGGSWFIFIYGLDFTTISAGQILTLRMKVAPGTPAQTFNIPVTNLQFTNTNVNTESGIANPGTVTVTATGGPQVSLTKAVDKSTALSGSVLTYTISYTNGGAASASNFKISDAVPAGTTVTGTPSNGGVLNAGTITWSLGTIPAAPAVGSSGSVSFQVQVQ